MIAQSDRVVEIRRQVEVVPPIQISLDDLLNEVMDVTLQTEHMKNTRRKLAAQNGLVGVEVDKDGNPKKVGERDICGLTRTERDKLRAQVLKWEVENEWNSQEYVALEQIDTCMQCGEVHAHIVGIYQSQTNRENPALKRFVLWTPEEPTDTRLPRKFMTQERMVALCPKCLWSQGFVETYKGDVKP